MSWLSRNAASIEACAAVVTALVAAAALIGVKVQLDETERLQKAQSARETYRAHLALAATLPHFAQPVDTCQLLTSDQAGAYYAFVDHLLYSAEQMLDVSTGWEPTFISQFSVHADYVCSVDGPAGDTDETARLLAEFKTLYCPVAPTCSQND